jgi:hypothetical protein
VGDDPTLDAWSAGYYVSRDRAGQYRTSRIDTVYVSRRVTSYRSYCFVLRACGKTDLQETPGKGATSVPREKLSFVRVTGRARLQSCRKVIEKVSALERLRCSFCVLGRLSRSVLGHMLGHYESSAEKAKLALSAAPTTTSNQLPYPLVPASFCAFSLTNAYGKAGSGLNSTVFFKYSCALAESPCPL